MYNVHLVILKKGCISILHRRRRRKRKKTEAEEGELKVRRRRRQNTEEEGEEKAKFHLLFINKYCNIPNKCLQ